jgi:predicted anti-sigma-YlaC factor YlaD
MNEHDSILRLLSLYAAQALDSAESKRVEAHLQLCAVCRTEWSVWEVYASAARQQPQPVVPGDLLARTHARVMREREKAEQRRTDILLLSIGIALSWAVSLATWYAVRELTGGMLVVLGTNLLQAGPWFLTTMLAAWATAGVAAIVLGRNRELRRVL